jgi:hypothetical protein
LGPSYPYYKNIKMPSQIGMSSNGTMQQLGNNINGLIQYVEVLVSGDSNASASGGPLGNKFFLKTGAKCAAQDTCTDPSNVSTCQQVDRYIYVDNVPSGNIPFISAGLGVDFSDFKGLIPGSMGNLNVLNPFGIMRAFESGTTPPCQQLTMQTIDNNNVTGTQTEFVTVLDIQNMDPCSFQNGQNPVTGQNCSQGFTQREKKNLLKSRDSLCLSETQIVSFCLWLSLCDSPSYPMGTQQRSPSLTHSQRYRKYY